MNEGINEMDENVYLSNVSPSGIKKKKQETTIVKNFFCQP